MSGAARIATAIALGALALWLVAASSAASIAWHADDAAELRLSWSARPERIEVCRRLSEEEMQARPAHMRQAVECTGRLATYDLTVAVDGESRASEVIRGGGLRNDRPMYLLRSYRVSPGQRTVRVGLYRRESVDSAPARPEQALAAVAPVLVLDTVITFEPGRAVLVAYDQEARVLRVR